MIVINYGNSKSIPHIFELYSLKLYLHLLYNEEAVFFNSKTPLSYNETSDAFKSVIVIVLNVFIEDVIPIRTSSCSSNCLNGVKSYCEIGIGFLFYLAVDFLQTFWIPNAIIEIRN